MSGDFHERLTEAARPLPSDRSCGFAVAALCLILAWTFRRTTIVPEILASEALLLAALSIVHPSWLHPLAVLWLGFGRLLHRVVSPILMGVLYFGIVTPFGLAMRLWYDPLRRKQSAAGDSYWIDVEARDTSSSMRNQF
ncbi:MAG: hypothetical protein U1E93_03635 [Alphaproteobacteria bacterium]